MDTASPANEVVRRVVDLVWNVITEVAKFESNLQNHTSTVLSLQPLFNEMEKLNIALNRPAQETQKFADLLKQGKVLTEKCSKINSFEFGHKKVLSAKLKEWKISLKDYIDIEFPLTRSLNGKTQLFISGFSRSCGVPQLPRFVVGLDQSLRDLKSMLSLNYGVPAAVVSAPGGYGKTTLAILLCHDKDIKDKFVDNIFFVRVSKTPNIYAIVRRIFQHKGLDPPEFQSEEDAVDQLGFFFKKIGCDPILFVLDDVCSEWQPRVDRLMFPNIPGFKVLVTSRDNFPEFDGVTYKLKPLNDQNALHLFRDSASLDDNKRPKISNNLVNAVVKVCKGSPLLLTVVGGSLRGRPETVWKMWLEGESIFDSNNYVLDVLKTSIDFLEEKPILKDLYLDLALFPQDKKIPATLLMDMWTEMYCLDDHGTSTNGHLHYLYYKNLIDLMSTREDDTEVDFDCDCDGYYVTQHDVLRELAIYMINKEPIQHRKRLILNLPKSDLDSSHQLPNHTCLLSISTDETVNSIPSDLNLSEVEVLILSLQTQNYTLPEFMKKMEVLKVLIVTNNEYSPTDIHNLPVLSSLSTLKRIRLELVSISSLSSSSYPMMSLQKISLSMCSIGDALDNCTAAMFPSLTQFEIDSCDDLVCFPFGLCSILTLTKLIISNCLNLISLSEDFGKLTNLEVLRLYSCIKLQELPKSIGNLGKLKLMDISDCIRLRKLPDETTKLSSLKKLYMLGCQNISNLPECIEELSGLEDVICDPDVLYLWKEVSHVNARAEKGDAKVDWLS